LEDPNKPKNTAAFSQLGNLYQYLIVVELCFEQAHGDVISIETLGDITTKDYQYEIKHHKDPNHVLIDTHVDLWKTLSNWVKDRALLENYSNHVLLTSSIVRLDTLVGDWNHLDALARLEKLKATAASNPDNKTIAPYASKLFSFDESYTEGDLSHVLSKIVIKHSYESAPQLLDKLCEHKILEVVPKQKKMAIIISLLGYIVSVGVTSTSQWDIEVSAFYEFLKDQMKYILNDQVLEFPDVEYEDVGDKYIQYRFVKEILEIPYEKQVASAAKDYHLYQKTIGRLSSDNPHALRFYSKAIDDVAGDVQLMKDDACENIVNVDEAILIKESKRLYRKVLLNINKNLTTNHVNGNSFRKGIVHMYVNRSLFKWRIRGSDIED